MDKMREMLQDLVEAVDMEIMQGGGNNLRIQATATKAMRLLNEAARATPAQPAPSCQSQQVPEKIEWSYSTNGETYHGEEASREDVIALALAEIGETEGTFWIGKNKRHIGLGTYITESVIESLQEQAYEDCGEFAETYLDDVTKEEEAELADFITDWAARVDRSNFWTVYDTEQIDISEALAAPSIAQDGQKSEGA